MMGLSEEQEKRFKEKYIGRIFGEFHPLGSTCQIAIDIINEVLEEPEKKWKVWILKHEPGKHPSIYDEDGAYIMSISCASSEKHIVDTVEIRNLIPTMLEYVKNSKIILPYLTKANFTTKENLIKQLKELWV